jgi:uracil-DNA glycosylase family 4
MGADTETREELLELVRSLMERLRVDEELGKPLSYLSHENPGDAAPTVPGTAMSAEMSTGETAGLEAVRSALGECRRCPLGSLRKRLVFGEGNPHATLVFVGEAPGADEDAQGKPFVGPAGQLLTRIIEAMEMKRRDVYICNILKCRPPGNRNPQPDEIAACEPFLIRQIEAIRPQVICTLGSFAAHTLLKSEAPISTLRGRFHRYRGIPLMPTYHPAYLLRNPGAKKQAWADVQEIMKILRQRS